jgi:ABC-type bacteriocin/lantibiotic exporter with double-glycine peptidase domain
MESTFKLGIGEIITSELCSSTQCLALLEGKVRVLQKMASGKEETITSLGKGDTLNSELIQDPNLKFIASEEVLVKLFSDDLTDDLDRYVAETIQKIRNSKNSSDQVHIRRTSKSIISQSINESPQNTHSNSQESHLETESTYAQEDLLIKESSNKLQVFNTKTQNQTTKEKVNSSESASIDNGSAAVLNEILQHFKHSAVSEVTLYNAKNIDELAYNIKAFGFEIEIASSSWKELLEAKFPFVLQDSDEKFYWIVNKKKEALIQKTHNFLKPVQLHDSDYDSPQFLTIKVSPQVIEKEEKPYNLDWYFDFIKSHWNMSTQMLIASVLVQFVAISSPIFYMVIFDRVFGHQNLHTLDIMTGGMIILTVFDLTVKVVKSYVLAYQLELLDKAGYKSLLQRIFSIPLAKSAADLNRSFSQSISEFTKTNQVLLTTILVTSLDVFFSIILFTVLLCINAPLTLISMASLIPISIITFWVAPGMQKRAVEYNKQQRAYQIKLTEALESPETVKSINAGKHLQKSLTQQATQTFEGGFRARFDQVNGGNLVGFLGAMGSVVTLYYGAHEVLEGRVSYGAYLAINMMSRNLIGSFQKLFGSLQQFHGAINSLEQLKSVYQEDSESHATDGIHLDSLQGHIQVVDLNFRYTNEAPFVLKNINLEIQPGAKVILTGKSGAGKTSLIRLLQRLYEPSTGYILLDNFNVANIELDDLRKQVGVALQRPFLYAGTIKENISIGQPSASMREIVEAASIAQLEQFLLKNPKGFDAPVAAMGSNFSGGQAARIALARVLLRKPSILVLDEALASLDPSLTGSIFSLLLEKYKKKTCIFVTDYVPVHAQADHIVVLQEGEIVEQGSYNELVNARGYYYHLFATELAIAK